MKQVGVRELRQNLSVYLRQVAEGEGFEVTDRGHPVAVLAPLPPAADALDRLVAAGRMERARLPFETLPPPLGPVSRDGTEALTADREERL